MGLLLSLRKKESTETVLDALSQKISLLQETRVRTTDLERRLASKLVIYSSVLYVVAAVCWYYWGAAMTGEEWYSRLLYTLPFFLSPLLLVLLRRFLRWFFVRRITQAEADLKKLEGEREKIFRQLMETETYKRVVELMKKYFPEKLKDNLDSEPKTDSAGDATEQPKTNSDKAETTKLRDASPSHSGLRHRRTPALGGQPNGATRVPHSPNPPSQVTSPHHQPPPYQQTAPLVRPILPQNRSTADRLIDWILGDGVENRYALICCHCHSHNGMALREEFEYMSFRCAYCGFFNQAHKPRPGANQTTNLPIDASHEAASVSQVSTSLHGSQTNLAGSDSGSNDNLSDAREAETSQSPSE